MGSGPLTPLTLNAELGRDPTRTITLRRQYARAFSKRWRWLKGAIREGVSGADAFGLGQDPPRRPAVMQEGPEVRRVLGRLRDQLVSARQAGDFDTARRIAREFLASPGRFNFPSTAQKLNAWSGWLQEAVQSGILEVELTAAGEIATEAGWQQTFVRRAYGRGLSDADRRLQGAGLETGETRVQRAMSLPIHSDALEVLVSRNFTELQGVTEAAAQQMRRTLADGLAEGLNPRRTATLLNQRVDAIGLARSRVIARTETIRAYSESTLNRFEQFGVSEVEGQAEFATAGDDRVCPICETLEGEVFTIKEARGVIPVHPQCRCAWLPVVENLERLDVGGVRRALPA